MADQIQLEIVTPRGAALSAAVDEVTAPSVEGEFGVLPGHLPLLAALRTGIVTYRRGSVTTRCAVGPGFAEAGPDRLVILTDDYTERERVDPVLIRRELASVQHELQQMEGVAIVGTDTKDADVGASEARTRRESLVQRENWLAVQLELYGDPPPATMRLHEEFGPPMTPADDEPDSATDGGGSRQALAPSEPKK
ncbi:MAG: ATP synthase F1 subunit epsilon [Myxococcota bacterium]|nr:ATP synthase F1 subunit epsilon [Myxococcota bacterium]